MENGERSHLQASRREGSSIVGGIVVWFGIFTFFLPLVTVRTPLLGEVSLSLYEMTARDAGNEESPSLSHAIEHEEQLRSTGSLACPNRRVPRRTSSGVAGRHLATRGGTWLPFFSISWS